MEYSDLDLSVLKGILTNKRYAIDFASECDTKIFSPDIWNFANIVISYVKSYKEVPTLRVLTEKFSKNEQALEYCSNLFKVIDNFSYDDREYKFDLQKIKKRYAERQVLELKSSLLKDNSSLDVDGFIKDAQRKIQNVKSLNKTKAYERRTLKENIDFFREEFNEKLKNPDFDRGVMTGYSVLDSCTGGLRPGELLLIGGESGAGKSMLLMNMAIQMWLQENTINTTSDFKPGNDVLYFSLEMPYKPCFNRVLSRLSNVPSKALKQPVSKDGSKNLAKDDRVKIQKALQFIKNYPNEFEIIDIPRGATAEQIETLYEDAKNRFNPKIVVVDYLGIMDDDSKDDDWLKLGIIAGKLHELSRVHNLIMLSAVQLNRNKAGSKDSEDRVGMHRIGRSALIMTHANIGIQIHTRPNEKANPDMEYFIIKNRDGEQNKGRLLKNLSCGTLTDIKQDGNDDNKYEFTYFDDISQSVDAFEI